MIEIYNKDNLDFLKEIQDNSIDLIYIDPPYNTKKVQKRGDNKYSDNFESLSDFLLPRLQESYRVLKNTGSFFIQLDYRECHYIKIELDKIFGKQNFVNEIIWHYDFGGKSKKFWPRKHDNIFFYKKSDTYTFNYDDIEYIPYMSKLCGQEKFERGKKPTDTWWFSIVGTNSKEKTGYPTQKPEKLLERIIKVHSKEDDTVLDFFAGSGTTGSVCEKQNRNCILCDINPQALAIMKKRFGDKAIYK